MSFEAIYTQYYHELYGFALLLQKSPAEAEDLVQDAFSRYYVELQKATVFENPRAWLYRVLLNLSSSQIRLKLLHERYTENKSFEATDAPYEPDFLQSEKQQIVFSVLERMEERDKQLLMLYHNGLSYQEMAEVLKMNPASVGKTLVRAIEKLKKLLKMNYHEMFE